MKGKDNSAEQLKISVDEVRCQQLSVVLRRCLQAMDTEDYLIVTGQQQEKARVIRRTCIRHGYYIKEDIRRNGSHGKFCLYITNDENNE